MDQPRIVRELQLLMLLANNRYMNKDEICERFGFCERTFFRYIDTFREAGFAVKKNAYNAYRLETALKTKYADRRVRFSITRSLASLGFRLACPPSRATACLDRLCPHLRVNAFVSRPNRMAVRGSSVLGLTGMRLFVRVGGVERAETVTQRQPTRKRHRTTHLHSVWPPRRIENVNPFR